MAIQRLLVSIGVIASLSIASTANAEMPINQYQKLRDNDFTKTYVTGLGIGMFWANTYAKYNASVGKGSPLYCPPERLPLGGENYLQMLDSQIKENAYTPDTPIELVLMQALVKVFKCPGSH